MAREFKRVAFNIASLVLLPFVRLIWRVISVPDENLEREKRTSETIRHRARVNILDRISLASRSSSSSSSRGVCGGRVVTLVDIARKKKRGNRKDKGEKETGT